VTSGEKTVDTFLDKTSLLVVGLYSRNTGGGAAGDAGRSFVLAGRGDYPGSVNTAFSFSKGWKRDRSYKDKQKKVWKSESGNGAMVSLCVTGDSFVMSDGTLFPETGRTVSEDFYAFSEDKVAAGWAPDALPLNLMLNAFGLPIRIPATRLDFAAREVDDGFDGVEMRYEIILQAGMPGEREARSVAALFNAARLLFRGASGAESGGAAAFARILLAREAEVTGSTLVITTSSMDRETITLLLGSFLVAK
jgi:hypothetical protein